MTLIPPIDTTYLNVDEYLNVGPTTPDTPDTIQSVIRGILCADEYMVPLIHGRVYDALMLPKNIEYPCITLQRISETLDPDTMFRRTTVQIDCYSTSHVEADTIAETVLSVLLRRRQSTSQLLIFSIKPETLNDLSDQQTRLFRVTGDYAVIWRKK